MAEVTFFTVGEYTFKSDERDVRTDTCHEDIMAWCKANDIVAGPVMCGQTLPYNIWRVKEERDRVLFKLRWSV
jgi:hypothetical protein